MVSGRRLLARAFESSSFCLAMEIRQVTMTPEWASSLLLNNKHNRKARPVLAAQIASDIRAGRWMLTPQTVSVATDGTLLDGQHRLMAIVQAGMPVELMLATDCPAECFSAIDTGQARSPGDILKIEGATCYSNVAAIIRLTHLYQTCPNNVWVGGLAAVSKQQLLAHYRKDAEAWQEAARFAHRTGPFIQVTAVGALSYLCNRRKEGAEVDEYFRLYCSGEMLSSGNPILALRNYQAAQYRIAYVKRAQTQLACHIKAYTYWRDGASLKQFKTPGIPPMPQL